MAEKSLTYKTKPLNKDEVMLFIDLIMKHEVITSKATDATNNKLKEDAWNTLAEEFAEQLGVPRRTEQLRFKWDNLKKAARKRNAAIKQNNLTTGGGESCIGQDEILDRVALIIGDTCTTKNYVTCTPKKILLNNCSNTRNKKRKLCEDLLKAQIEKELVLAAYFRAKTEKVLLECEKLKSDLVDNLEE